MDSKKATIIGYLAINTTWYGEEVINAIKNMTWDEVMDWVAYQEEHNPDNIAFTCGTKDMDYLKDKKLSFEDGDRVFLWFF